MTFRIGAAIAAGFLAIGILVGAAGSIVIRDATAPGLADHMRDAAPMMSMMGGGDLSTMMGGLPMGPNASMAPGDHESHHGTPSPRASR